METPDRRFESQAVFASGAHLARVREVLSNTPLLDVSAVSTP